MCHACTPLISHTAGVRVDRAAPCRGRRHRRQRTGLCTRAPHVRCCRHGASPRAEHDGGLGCALCAMSGVCLHGVVVHTAIYLHRTRVHTPHPRTFGVVMLILATLRSTLRTRMCVKVTEKIRYISYLAQNKLASGQHYTPRGVRIEFLSVTSFLAVFGAQMVNESVPVVWTN